MYGIALIGPNMEYIKGIPRATEFPKHEPSPNKALSSGLNFRNFELMKKPIKKIKTPEPKNENNN